MLDKPNKTARLMVTLKAAVPFEVELLASTLARMRERSPDVPVGAKEMVFEVIYEPGRGGIVCLIRPTAPTIWWLRPSPTCACTHQRRSPAQSPTIRSIG